MGSWPQCLGPDILQVRPCPDQCFLSSFVFLQLYHSPFFGDESNKPILLPNEVGLPSVSTVGWVTRGSSSCGSRLCSIWVESIILGTGALLSGLVAGGRVVSALNSHRLCVTTVLRAVSAAP